MTTFLFVRHGEPDYEAVQDWAKIHIARDFAPLTEKGTGQIRQSAELLKKENAQIIISSPFTRCLQGAAILSKELNLEVRVEPMLYEWQLDATQSVRNPLLYKKLIWQFNHCRRTKHSKWESKESVRKRVLGVLERYLSYDRVIVSCHAVMLGMATEDERPYEYGEIKRFVYEGSGGK